MSSEIFGGLVAEICTAKKIVNILVDAIKSARMDARMVAESARCKNRILVGLDYIELNCFLSLATLLLPCAAGPPSFLPKRGRVQPSPPLLRHV